MGFPEVIELLKEFGIFQFYLPFVITFAIFYGLLSKSKIFGDSDKDKRVRNINLFISLSAALFVLLSVETLFGYFTTVFNYTTMGLVGIMCFLMVFYMIMPAPKEGEKSHFQKNAKFIILFAAIVTVIIFLFSSGFDLIPGFESPGLNLSTQDIVVITLVIVTVLIIWFITRGEKKNKKKIIGYKPGEPVPVYES